MARILCSRIRSILTFSLKKVPPKLGRRLLVTGVSVFAVGGGAYVSYKRNCYPIHSYCVENVEETSRQKSIEKAIQFSHDLIRRKKDEGGVPGIVVAVSVDGETVWAEGIGYADVENRVPCNRNTVMRIGSISKPIAMTAVAKLWEEGKLDLDKPIQLFVPTFPEKTFQGKKVTLTLRHLLHHLGGIRHYKQDVNNEKGNAAEKRNNNVGTSDAELQEFYLNRKFKTTEEALDLIRDDPLLSEPGSKYLYTTFGWTLVSAAVEGACKETYPKYLNKVLKTIGMNNTYLDKHDAIIYNRARFYGRDNKGVLSNVPCVDSSYKWAGGGLLSTVDDLVLYGNSMLCSLQTPDNSASPGFLKPSTVEAIWTPAPETSSLWGSLGKYGYGMGWKLSAQETPCRGCREAGPFVASHTGSSIGGTSALTVLPSPCELSIRKCRWNDPPHGVVVAVIGNMTSVAYGSIADEIALQFAQFAK